MANDDLTDFQERQDEEAERILQERREAEAAEEQARLEREEQEQTAARSENDKPRNEPSVLEKIESTIADMVEMDGEGIAGGEAMGIVAELIQSGADAANLDGIDLAGLEEEDKSHDVFSANPILSQKQAEYRINKTISGGDGSFISTYDDKDDEDRDFKKWRKRIAAQQMLTSYQDQVSQYLDDLGEFLGDAISAIDDRLGELDEVIADLENQYAGVTAKRETAVQGLEGATQEHTEALQEQADAQAEIETRQAAVAAGQDKVAASDAEVAETRVVLDQAEQNLGEAEQNAQHTSAVAAMDAESAMWANIEAELAEQGLMTETVEGENGQQTVYVYKDAAAGQYYYQNGSEKIFFDEQKQQELARTDAEGGVTVNEYHDAKTAAQEMEAEAERSAEVADSAREKVAALREIRDAAHDLYHNAENKLRDNQQNLSNLERDLQQSQTRLESANERVKRTGQEAERWQQEVDRWTLEQQRIETELEAARNEKDSLLQERQKLTELKEKIEDPEFERRLRNGEVPQEELDEFRNQILAIDCNAFANLKDGQQIAGQCVATQDTALDLLSTAPQQATPGATAPTTITNTMITSNPTEEAKLEEVMAKYGVTKEQYLNGDLLKPENQEVYNNIVDEMFEWTKQQYTAPTTALQPPLSGTVEFQPRLSATTADPTLADGNIKSNTELTATFTASATGTAADYAQTDPAPGPQKNNLQQTATPAPM